MSLLQNPMKLGSSQEARLLSLGGGGGLLTSPLLPAMGALVALGKVFTAKESATTTCATAIPTTTAGFTLQNPAGSDKLYLVVAATGENDVNAASLETVSIAAMVNKNPLALFTRDIATSAVSVFCGGAGMYPGSAVLDEGATVVDDAWFVIANHVSNVKNSAAWGSIFAPLPIPVVLRPGGAMSLEAVSSSGTTEVKLGFVWAELDAADLR